MSYRDQLAAAIELAGWSCPFCYCSVVSIFDDPLTGEAIPDSGHYVGDGPADSCASLLGGEPAFIVHNTLWAAIEKHLFTADYCVESWAHRELVSS